MPYLTRATAAAYLSEELGRRVTPNALHRLAHRGTGPRFAVILGNASYTRADLDAWLAEQAARPSKADKQVAA